jgi:PAS domain S-box-containing protein
MNKRSTVRRWLPLSVLGVALVVTLIATYYVRASIETRDALRFSNQVLTTRQAIYARMETQIALLRAGAAYMSASESVSRESFRQFVDRLELRRRYPGIQGIGFSLRIDSTGLDSLTRAVRAQGFADFTYHRFGTAGRELHTIVFLEPEDRRNRAAMGFDMYSEPTRRRAMELARDSGTATVTRRVRLRQEIDQDVQHGFLIYVPVYSGGEIPPTLEARRLRLRGFVYSPLRADDLFEQIAELGNPARADVHVYAADEPGDSSLLFDSRGGHSPEGVEPRYVDTVGLDVAGRRWSLVVASRPAFEEASGREQIPYVFIAGIILSALLFTVSRSEAIAREDAERSAASLARSQEALRASESRFRAIFNHAAVGIAETDLDGRIVMVNRRFSEFVGRMPDELIGRPWSEMAHAEDSAVSAGQVAELIATGEPFNLLSRWRRDDGSVAWGNVSAGLVRNAGGEPANMVLVVEDVTARQHARAALRESELRLRRLVDSNIFGVASGEYRGVITYANDYFLEMLGYDRHALEVGDVRWDTIAPPAVREVIRNATAQLARTGAAAPIETEFVRRDGSVVPTLIGSALLSDSLESGSRIIAFCLDLTERRRADLELRAAKEAAEAASLAKDRFLAVLSHELRTPLTPVMAALEAFQGESLPRELGEILAIIKRNVGLEARLIDDLLDLTRIANGKLKLFVEPLDMHRLIRESLEIVEDIQRNRLTIDVRFDARASMVRGDAARLQQVLWNVVRNAARYTPAGGHISIRTRNEGERLAIAVVDTGVGIAPEDLERIFNAFEQGGGSGQRHGGLGLGLAISRMLVEMHGGSISARSEGPGRGATFTIELPDAFAAEEPKAQPGVAGVPTAARPGARILLVEDHADTRAVLERLLRRYGYDVRTAGSVAAAVEAAGAPFDVLVSDIGLPDGTGYELAERLRERGELCAIALSGYGMEEDVRRSREAGFAEHLTKPVDIHRLHEVIESLLDH